MRTIKISLLAFPLHRFRVPLSGTLFLCALALPGLLAGCAPADQTTTYREMTQQELAQLPAEEAGSVSPPQAASSQPNKQEEPVSETNEKSVVSNEPVEKKSPVDQSSPGMQSKQATKTTADSADKKSNDSNQKKNDNTKQGKLTIAKAGSGSPTTPTNVPGSNRNRAFSLQPGMMRARGALPGDLTGKIEKREPKLLIPEKTFRQEGEQGAIRVSFDDIDLLKVLNMEPVPENAVEMFPDWLSGLDGKRVRIRGFMFPTMSQKGITYFQFVRDNEICCFGRTPKIYDRISTVLKKGESTDYIQGRPFDVIGTLRIDPIYVDGEWLQLYLLEDAQVIDDKS